ncbi:hypothetical protein KFK09_023992 [Dendrobium nobile]|uniref:AB hydrolase-1 domain-containing protein n=1 Tax=Dendrobium nobile TaxID=94219 RepID=A0A8T3ABE4_DENNO|nr:hypothetical protein KFK09_023992 [Dendrobium nobile]
MNSRLIGNGEITLVLSHGYGASQAVWDEVVPKLSKRYQLFLFDWCFSEAVKPPLAFDSSKDFSFEGFADELISLLDNNKLKCVVFVGHSMAGMVGCLASIKRPDLFSHLVLVGASPRYVNSDDYQGGFQLTDVENILTNIQTNFQAWAEEFAPMASGITDQIHLKKLIDSFKGMNPTAALSLAKMIFLSDQRHVLEHVNLPCTIIQGTEDIVVPVVVGDYMKRKLKGETSLVNIEKNAHFPQITSPKKFVEILRKILN